MIFVFCLIASNLYVVDLSQSSNRQSTKTSRQTTEGAPETSAGRCAPGSWPSSQVTAGSAAPAAQARVQPEPYCRPHTAQAHTSKSDYSPCLPIRCQGLCRRAGVFTPAMPTAMPTPWLCVLPRESDCTFVPHTMCAEVGARVQERRDYCSICCAPAMADWHAFACCSTPGHWGPKVPAQRANRAARW